MNKTFYFDFVNVIKRYFYRGAEQFLNIKVNIFEQFIHNFSTNVPKMFRVFQNLSWFVIFFIHFLLRSQYNISYYIVLRKYRISGIKLNLDF